MLAISRQNLEQVLNFLDLSTLELIDSKYRQDAYTFGKHPPLKYSAEALTEYASALYRYILPHFGSIEVTEDEYISKWLAPYTTLQAHLKAKEADFIGILTDIADNPMPLPESSTEPVPEQCLSTTISDFLNKQNNYFENTNDFLISPQSPLRKRFEVEDSRVMALIAEVDSLREAGNAAIDSYIGTKPTLTEQATATLSYKPVPKPKYGSELKKYRQLVEDCLAYYNLKPTDISLITAHKDHLSQTEWSIVEQALTTKILSPKTDKLITKLKKFIKDAKKLNSKFPKLRAISETKHLLSDEDYSIVDQLLHSTVDWTSSANRIINQYKENSKSCMASVDYQALCVKIDIANHLIDHYCNPTQPECKALEPYVTLALTKNPDAAKQLLQNQIGIHAVTANIHNIFINSFVAEVEKKYSLLEPISIFALVDAEKALEDDEKSSFTDYTPEQTEQRIQTTFELLARYNYNTNWFCDYADIHQPLSACLHITLNNLTVCPEALSHGAIIWVCWNGVRKLKLSLLLFQRVTHLILIMYSLLCN